MADGAELVTLKLTFWHKDKKPGDLVQVRRDELHQWRGFAVPLEDSEPEPAKTADDTTTPKTPAKTTTAKA
ncbi:hypothetical protein ACF1GW_38870 [Streptomyces achromogenes]|uniref:hypothetical protein n=1 Tax=Streptomyces achromogenes TaxID=67255 RepID=UPI0036F71726